MRAHSHHAIEAADASGEILDRLAGDSAGAGRWSPFVLMALVTWSVTTGLALELDPAGWFSHLVSAVAVFVFLPWVMAACLAAVCVPLALVLLLLALALSPGRPSGVKEVLAELFSLPLAIIPGHYRAMRRVRSPRIWGFVVGVMLATATVGSVLISRMGAHGV